MSDTTETVNTVTTQQYLDLIPPINRVQPVFSQWVQALCAPYVALTNFLNSMILAFDLDVAVGVQLDQIGLWVGISRYVQVPITNVFFSFDISGVGFDQGVWLGPYSPDGELSALDDDSYRFLLRYKIARNHWDGRAGTALAAYQLAFSGTAVNILIQDNQDMTMTVTFQNSASLTAVQIALITAGVVDIAPMGVTLTNVLE